MSGSRIIGIVIPIIGCIITIIVALIWDLLALLFLIFFVVFAVMCWLPQKGIAQRAPKSVTIDNGTIEVKSSLIYQTRTLDMVKAVKDMGDWYVFDFFLPNKSGYFICQKSLLVEGTLEEFEQLFEGKIVRKTK